MSEKTFKLSKPITVQKDGKVEQIDKITMREPSGDEVFDFGMLYSSTGQLDRDALKNWVARLGGVDKPFIGRLHVRDLFAIVKWLGEQFGDETKDAEGN